MDAFRHAVANSKNPLCYNGNLCSKEQIEALSSDFPTVDAVMLGRALIADPGMLSPGGTTATALEQFHDELLENYTEVFASSRNAMFRMKENWHYLRCRFDGGDKLFKQLRKTTDLSEYRRLTHEIFHNVPLAAMLTPDW